MPPLVMIHGLFTTHYAFANLIPELAPERRVVAIDLPGAGDSDHPTADSTGGYAVDWLAHAVAQTVGALQIDRFDVLGHDLGGAVAALIAAEEPRRVRRVVLVDPVLVTVSLPLTGALAVVPSLGAEVFRRTLRRADVHRFVAQCSSTPELVRETDVNVYWDRLSRRGGREAAYAMLSQLPTLVTLRDRLRAVQAPTMVVWGDRDRLVSPEQGERLVDLLPHAQLRIVEGCGHNPADERPAELAAIVREHLA